MAAPSESLLRMHAGAFNARDPGLLAGTLHPNAPCWRDGEFLGEGPDGLRKAIAAEHRGGEPFARVMDVDGEPLVVEWSGPEGHREPLGVLRLQARGGRVSEVRLEHDRDVVLRLVSRATSR